LIAALVVDALGFIEVCINVYVGQAVVIIIAPPSHVVLNTCVIDAIETLRTAIFGGKAITSVESVGARRALSNTTFGLVAEEGDV
jgi:hypothetical protein